MSASSSKSSQTTSYTTQHIADSYNQTFNKVFNLSNAGNVNISTPPDATANIMPYILAAVGILGIVALFKA